MSLSATALVTLLEAREFLGGETDSHVARITACINAATEYCEKKVESNIASRVYTDELHDGSGCSELALDHDWITAATAVSVLTSIVPETWEAIDLAAYPLVIVTPGRRRIAFRNRMFGYGVLNHRVTYTAGFTGSAGALPTPDLLKQACLQTVKELYEAKDDDGIQGVTSMAGGVGAQTITYLDRALPKTTLDILTSYRRRRF